MKASAMKSIRNIFIVACIYTVFLVLNKIGFLDAYFLQLIMLTCINLMMTSSLNLINGFTGQFSIGHAGFMAIGGYVSAIISTLLFPRVPSILQLPFFMLILLIGGCVAAFVGFLIGLPCLRLKGDYLAIVTLAFGEVIRAVIRMIPAIGGARGLPGIPAYSNYSIIFIITVISIIAIRNIVNSNHGRFFISIRENEIAAETLGINVFKYKVLAFVFSAFIAGIAGGLFAHLMNFIQPDQFSMAKSTDYLIFLYAGGTASISGSIISSIVLTILPEMLRFLSDWRLVIYAVLLVFIMLKRPDGLYGNKEFPALKVKNYEIAKKGA